MAMTRRELLAALSALGMSAACGSAPKGAAGGPYREIQQAGTAGTTVLVCMPDTPQTREVWRGLSDELMTEFQLVAIRVQGRNDTKAIAEGIRRHRPSALVLMNNPTVAAYRTFTASQPQATRLPVVVVMTSFLEGASLRAIGAAGISYEVPLITVVTNLRKLLALPVERIGVVYTESLTAFVQREIELARREKIQVVETRLRADPNVSDIKRALRQTKGSADAVWVLNDDRLLTPHLIADGWLPGLNEKPWRPTIVGAASLVSNAQSFGTLAVLPDHTALGVQAAEMVFQIADDAWRVPDAPDAQLPLSTTMTVDLRQARERFRLRDDALTQVDRIVE